MYNKSIYFTIALSILIAACGDTTSFTVNESEYRLNSHCPMPNEGDEKLTDNEYIQKYKGTLKYIGTKECNPRNSVCNSVDYKYNFENIICPKKLYPICVPNTDPDDPGFHCEAEARKGCENNGINYEHNDSICINDQDQKGTISTCNNKNWDTAQCDTSCNAEGNGCGECTNDEEKYVNDDSTGQNICKRAKCVNGSFDFEHAAECTEQVSCKLENGDRKCGECINGSTRCTKGQDGTQACINGIWSAPVSCPSNIHCQTLGNNSAECVDCSDGDVRYDNDENNHCYSSLCQNHQWQKEDTNRCQSEASCKTDKNGYTIECGECNNNEDRCIDIDDVGTKQRCISGEWQEQNKCIYDENTYNSCQDDTQCGSCRNGAKSYKNIDDGTENNGKCIPIICKDSIWQADDAEERICKDENNNPLFVSCTFGDKTTTCGECYNSDSRCIDSEDQSNIQTCQNGRWEDVSECSYDDQPTSCNFDNNKCGICHNGDTKYENITDESGNIICRVMLCQGGQWIEMPTDNENYSVMACKETVSCTRSSEDILECGNCLQNENEVTERCDNIDGAGQIRQCINGQWMDSFTCKQDKAVIGCKNDKCGDCKEEDIQFINDSDSNSCIKLKCINATWETDNNYKCENSCDMESTESNSPCGVCINGETRCLPKNNQDYQEKCIDGKWQSPLSCDQSSCQNTKCGECKNGDERYIENNSICHHQTCKDGSWGELPPEQTKENFSCNADLTGFGECNNKTYNSKCVDNSYTTCIHGKIITQHCQTGCSEDAKSCNIVTCNDGDPDGCEDGFEYKCIKNESQFELKFNPCELGICTNDDKNKCAECQNAKCENDTNNSAILTKCNAGSWESPVKKNDVSCNEAMNDFGICLNGSARCIFDELLQTNIESVCQNGAWKTANNCGTNSCKKDNTCGECTNGTERCIDYDSAGTKQKCVNGVWEDASDCDNNVSCYYEIDCGSCKNGSQQCITNDNGITVIQTCEHGIWKDESSCGTNSCNINGNSYKCGLCRNGDNKYEDQSNKSCIEYTCDNGVWANSNPCPNNYSCKKSSNQNTACGECINYTFSKSGMYAKHCFNGEWDDHYCAWGPTNKGEYYLCTLLFGYSDSPIKCYNKFDSGKNQYIGFITKNDRHCSTPDVSCRVTGHNASECGECMDYTTRCRDSLTQQTCVNGTWAFPENCENGCANDKCNPK